MSPFRWNSRAGRTPSTRRARGWRRSAFAAEPMLVLADEPTGNLDGATGHQIIDLMFNLSRRRGATLMLITHDTELAARSDRIIRLEDGLIVEATEPAEQAAE